jgi:hypothetical protein
MASALNQMGDPINVGDRVSIVGNIVSVSTADTTANVVVQPPLSANTFTVKAPDVYVPVTQTAEGAGASGNKLAAGQDCTVAGLVTAISGTGNTATLTVITFSSGTSISVPAGACYSDNV